MEKLRMKVGFAPTRRTVFSREAAGEQKTLVEARLREWGVDYVPLDWLNEEGLLYDPLDARRVAERFRAEGVDALFTPHCNFGTEAAVGVLAREMRKPLLLWGPRDEGPAADGSRLRDTQCGLFATSKVLRRMNVPFTYVVNSHVKSAVFERGFRAFLGAAAGARAFLGARIGQIGTRPEPFWTTMANEGELLERWGIEVVPLSLVELTQGVMARVEANTGELQETVADFRATADFSAVGGEQMARMAGLKMTLLEFARENALDALAIQCWSALQRGLQIRTCFVNGVLTDAGLPVACETDIHGALTSVLVQAAGMNERPTFFADLTIRHPENDNAELLWHCGCFPPSLAVDEEARGVEAGRFPAAGGWEIRGGDLTLARFDGDHGEYSLLMGEARGTEGPATNGTYLWVEVEDWPQWEEKFIYGPYIHHCVGIHGRLAPVLYEASKYIPGLEPDPVDPTQDDIRAYWRGDGLGEERD